MTIPKPKFETVYDEHYEDVWRYLLHATANVHDAMDLTSRTFLRACRAWPKYEPSGAPVKAWLFRIALHEWRREIRRRKISRWIPFAALSESQTSIVESVPAEVASAEQELQNNETFRALRLAVAKLPEKYETAVLLHYFEYMSVDQVANVLGRPAGTVKSLLHRAITMLRRNQGLREAYGLPDERGHESKTGKLSYEQST